jgi:single-strand DNA-binding protein
MSGSVNKVILIGNLGRDPEVKFLDGGRAVCNFSVACNETWKDKEGQKQERVEWVNIVAWGKLAELCGQYLKKGRQCFIEGKLQTDKYDKDGSTRYSTKVVASEVTFLGGKGDSPRDDGPPADDQDPAF